MFPNPPSKAIGISRPHTLLSPLTSPSTSAAICVFQEPKNSGVFWFFLSGERGTNKETLALHCSQVKPLRKNPPHTVSTISQTAAYRDTLASGGTHLRQGTTAPREGPATPPSVTEGGGTGHRWGGPGRHWGPPMLSCASLAWPLLTDSPTPGPHPVFSFSDWLFFPLHPPHSPSRGYLNKFTYVSKTTLAAIVESPTTPPSFQLLKFTSRHSPEC